MYYNALIVEQNRILINKDKGPERIELIQKAEQHPIFGIINILNDLAIEQGRVLVTHGPHGVKELI